jgi:hypothetical protein
MGASFGKIGSLLSRMQPRHRKARGSGRRARSWPSGLILDVRIPGSAAGWSKASLDSSAAKAEGESGNKRTPSV